MNLNSEQRQGEDTGEGGGPRHLHRFSLREVWDAHALSSWWTRKRPEGHAPVMAQHLSPGLGMNRHFQTYVHLVASVALALALPPAVSAPATPLEVPSAFNSAGTTPVKAKTPVDLTEVKARHPWRIAFMPKFRVWRWRHW